MQPALGPQRVPAARQPERGDVALPHLPIIADLTDDRGGPRIVEAKAFAKIRLLAQQAANVGDFRIREAVDVTTANAQVFGDERGEMHPADDVEPFVVAFAHHRARRAQTDRLRQDGQLVGFAALQVAEPGGLRAVRRVPVAAPGQKRLTDLGQAADQHRRVFDVFGPRPVGEVELGRGAGQDADGGTAKRLHRFHARGGFDDDAGAVPEIYPREQQAEAGLPRQRPAGVADKDVDLAGLERGEPGLRGHRDPFHLIGVAEHGRRDGAAIIGVDPAHRAGAVEHREAGDFAAGAAQHLPARPHRVQRRRSAGLRSGVLPADQPGGEAQQEDGFHDQGPLRRVWAHCIVRRGPATSRDEWRPDAWDPS